MRVAAVKPDHLGDMVLASLAIKAIAAKYPDTTLFAASRTRPLAEYLFPDLHIRSLDLPHLQKFRPDGALPIESSFVDLRDFDLVYFLRKDEVLTKGWAELIAKHAVIVEDRPGVHETELQAEALRQSGIFVELPETFSGTKAFPKRPGRVGLCISAGFFANRWLTMRWVEVARMMQKQGVEVTVIAGPAESDEAFAICKLARLDTTKSLLIGSSDFGAFLERLQDLDLVVATDSGTAHICSLVVPILSLFGGSPFRRFAPFGAHNRVLSRSLPCSPCCQFHEAVLNLCVTTECLTQILAAFVIWAIEAPPQPLGSAYKLLGDPQAQVFFGVSHAGQAR